MRAASRFGDFGRLPARRALVQSRELDFWSSVVADLSGSGRSRIVQISKRLVAIGVASAATVATGLGVATTLDTASATANSPTAKAHHLKFVAVSTAGHGVGPRSFVGTDVNRHHGKVVGYDTISGKFNRHTHKAFLRVALSRKGGLLFGQLTIGQSGHFTGKVTGGRGRFSGATGTIRGFDVPHSNKTFVRVRYLFY
jgi:hypothetical protein